MYLMVSGFACVALLQFVLSILWPAGEGGEVSSLSWAIDVESIQTVSRMLSFSSVGVFS